MIYPKFIKEGDTIGICPLSAGVGHKLDEYDESLSVLKQAGYKIKETKSVRNNNPRAAGSKVRAKEFDELVCDKDVDFINLVSGGDYQLETVPYINYEHIKNNPKWIMGYSDPTNILFPTTTLLDIATMYGENGGGFKINGNKCQKVNLEYMKGNLLTQKSYKNYCNALDIYQDNPHYDNKVNWLSKKEVDVSGRCIGGCFDVIEKLIGTPYDGTKDFIERYKEDGIVWYFDVFSMSSFNFYLSLLQMKLAGYFKYSKAVLIGRVAIPNIDNENLDYIKAADKALGKIPHIMEMDIGHSDPRMTLINGAIINVKYKDGKGSISFNLK